VNSEIKEF